MPIYCYACPKGHQFDVYYSIAPIAGVKVEDIEGQFCPQCDLVGRKIPPTSVAVFGNNTPKFY